MTRTITEEPVPVKTRDYKVLRDQVNSARAAYFAALEQMITTPHAPDGRIVIKSCHHNCGTCGWPKCSDRDVGGSEARIIGNHTKVYGCLRWIRKGAL